jgi:hypothetical protein
LIADPFGASVAVAILLWVAAVAVRLAVDTVDAWNRHG